MNTLKMEFYKLKHKKMGMMVILIGLFQYIYLAWAITKMHSDKIGQEWMTCLYVVFQINIILMPLFIAMIASRLSDIEHKGNTFKCLKVLVSSQRLFNTKILCGLSYLIGVVVFQLIAMVIVSKQQSFIQVMPTRYLGYYIGAVFLLDATLFLLQLNLSLLFTNQMIAFIVALVGTFVGLYSMFFSEKVSSWIVWGYYALLAPVRMNWDPATRIKDYYWINIPIERVFILIGLFMGLYIVGKRLFMRKEG